MTWYNPTIIEDFRTVARLAAVDLPADSLRVQTLPAPHVPPASLPAARMAVYIFTYGSDVLKVGKVGPNSQARYTNQHYNPGSAQSTLAASILADSDRLLLSNVEKSNVGQWIRNNVDRVNFLLDVRLGVPVLTLLESFLQCRLKPCYEGFKSQRL